MTKRIISSAGIQTFRVSVLAFTMALLGGCVSIQSAARKGDLEEVRSQLASGTNVNSKTFRMGLTALHGAAGNGHIEIVKLLLEKGADPNITQENSCPPLAYAAHGGHADIMEILIAHGADPQQRTVMELAARGGHIEAVEVLLEHGTDINVKGTDGYTALNTAVGHRHVELVKFLLSRGADVNATASYGRTPLFTAYRARNVKIRRILLQHGADTTLEYGEGFKIPQSFLDQLRE